MSLSQRFLIYYFHEPQMVVKLFINTPCVSVSNSVQQSLW